MMNVENIALIVESLAGADPLAASRSRPVVEARTILVAALLAQGMTEEAASRAIGFSRGTIHHYRELMRDAEKYGNAPDMLTNWKKLKALLDL